MFIPHHQCFLFIITSFPRHDKWYPIFCVMHHDQPLRFYKGTRNKFPYELYTLWFGSMQAYYLNLTSINVPRFRKKDRLQLHSGDGDMKWGLRERQACAWQLSFHTCYERESSAAETSPTVRGGNKTDPNTSHPFHTITNGMRTEEHQAVANNSHITSSTGIIMHCS
jgi:hypothetical protein